MLDYTVTSKTAWAPTPVSNVKKDSSLPNFFWFIYFVCVGDGGIVVHVWNSSEDNMVGLLLAFYHVGPRNSTQIFRLGSKHPY